MANTATPSSFTVLAPRHRRDWLGLGDRDALRSARQKVPSPFSLSSLSCVVGPAPKSNQDLERVSHLLFRVLVTVLSPRLHRYPHLQLKALLCDYDQ